MSTRQTEQPPATPSGERWHEFCRIDDPGASTRWFPGSEPPSTPNGREPYRVQLIVVKDNDDGCEAGVYLYWPGKKGRRDPITADEAGEMVGPVRLDGERVLEELCRQHPEADEHVRDSLFEGMVEKMLTEHLIDTCGKLWRHTQESAMRFAAIDSLIREIEDAADKTRAWDRAHG